MLAEQSKAFALKQRQASRATLRTKREEGERIAHAALESVIEHSVPTLGELTTLRQKRNKATRPEPEPLPDPAPIFAPENLERIQQAIDAAASHNPALRIAGRNALHRHMKLAKEILGWMWPIPGPWLASSTLEPTPFFPGLFRATAQTHALRTAFSGIPSKVPVGTDVTACEWAFGIAAIALCIYGFIDNLDQVRRILDGRRSGVRCRTIEDLLFVEVGEEKNVLGVRGLAATALARLAKTFSDDVLPSTDRLDIVLAMQIPQALSGNQHGITARLCATVAVSNLIELSGLSRLALDPEKGSVAMSIIRQRQLLEEGHGLDQATQAKAVSTASESFVIPARKRGAAIARKQYIRLIQTLHIGEGPKAFALTGERISQANITTFRNPLIRELTAYLAQGERSPVVACIAAFALHMTINGTREKAAPAWSTVHHYITAFGADLVNLAAELDFLQLDAEEYIDVYQDVIDRKPGEGQRGTAARQLVDFHAYLQAHHDVEAVDFSDLEGVNLGSATQVDAEIIQPQEFLRGLKNIAAHASFTPHGQPLETDRRRLFRQTEIFALLLRGSGARINELAALRFKDILATADATVLLIRPSRYRRLKTSSARRIVDISSRLTRPQRRLIADWIAAERARLKLSWKPTLPILGKLDEPKERILTTELRDTILQAMDDAVGGRTKVHRSRHLVAGEDLLTTWLSDEDWQAVRRGRVRIRRRVARRVQPQAILPRDLRQLSLRLGHRRPSTTVANYFHMAWATTSRAHHALGQFITRHTGAVALGVSVAGADKIIQRGGDSLHVRQRHSGWCETWLTHLLGNASVTPGRSTTIAPRLSSREPTSMGARRIERILRDIQSGVSPTQTCMTHGLTEKDLATLRRLAVEIERRTGFRIWPQSHSAQTLPRAARLFRRSSSLEAMLDMIDREPADPDRQLVLIVAQAYLTWAMRGQRNVFQWPSREGERLAKVLVGLGFSAEQIICTPFPDQEGFVDVRVRREIATQQFLNHEIAWLLVVAHITAESDALSKSDFAITGPANT